MSDPTTELAGKVAVSIVTELFKTGLSGLKEAEEWVRGKNKELDPFGRAAQKYAAKVEERYNSMRIFGMNKPVPLRNIYTRVNILEKITSHRRVSVKDLEQFFDRDQRSFGRAEETREGIEVVNQLQKFIVLGKPGAGKTTFLKYIALQALDGNLKRTRLPIFISLKSWSDSNQSLMEFIVNQFDICHFPNAASFIERMLSKGQCLLLLDGFDEVSHRIEDVIVEIRDFADKYSDNQFILSCRIAAYNYCFVDFTEVEIADFSSRQIETFINNWFGKGTSKSVACLEGIKTNKPIKELATIPLLLTMLCLAFDETMEFPANRAELYKEALDALLKKWDASRSIKRENIYRHLSLRRKESLFSRIAATTFQRNQYFLPQNELEKHIASYIQNLPEAKQETLEPDSEALLKAIEAQHGIFVERAKRIYSFSHLTFQEYFTARYLVDNADLGTLERLSTHITDSKWREVFLLTAGMLENADNFFSIMQKKIDDLTMGTVGFYLQEIEKNIVKPHSRYHDSSCRALAFLYACMHVNKYYGSSNMVLFAHRDTILYIIRITDPVLNKDLIEQHPFDFKHSISPDRAISLFKSLTPKDASALRAYLDATRILLDCLQTECYVSRVTRQGIYSKLLKAS